jgi:phage tail-like protein
MANAFTNVLSTLATDPVRNFRFLVTFLPPTGGQTPTWAFDAKMGFTSVSGLTVATEAIQYREGGYNTTVHQLPGQTSFSPVTFSRGVMLENSQNYKWMRRLFSVISSGATAGVGADFRCDIDIKVLSHPNAAGLTVGSATNAVKAGENADPHIALRFRIYNAWITNLSYSGLDAGGNSLMVEEMTVVHEGWDATYATDYTASAAQFNNNEIQGSENVNQ